MIFIKYKKSRIGMPNATRLFFLIIVGSAL